MIVLYDANEKEFTSLGIGVLSDAISCEVSEELNGGYELEMEYPITGSHYSDLQETRIILAKANDTYQPQPFRIYKITKPIDGTVTVYAEHISYDTSKVPVRKFEAEKLEDICYIPDVHDGALKQAEIISSPFKFLLGADKKEGTAVTYKTKCPNNMRSLLMGSDESILNIYSGEFIFDRFNITLCNRRGIDRDFTIRYSKNMIDLEQETSSELMYTGVCPYYSNTTTETKVGIGKKYKEIYISKEKVTPLIDQDGNTMYPSTWLTYKSTGLEAITNILSLSVTNIIASEGEFQNHLVTAKRATPQGSTQVGSYFYDVTYNMAYLNKNNVGDQNRYWLFKDIDLTECYENENHHVHHGEIFRIYTPGDNLYKVYVFDDSLGSDGEYRLITSDDHIDEYPPTIPSVDNTQEEKDNIIVYEGELIFVNEVRAIPKDGQTAYSETWLQKVEEQIQIINSDPRWKVPEEGGDIIQTVGVPSKTIYKVPSDEVATMAYPIEGIKEYTREWLTLGVTSYINPNVEQYSENWLYTKDSDGNPVQIIPNDYTTYGVTIDENISYYKWIDSAYEQIELKNALPIPDEQLIDGRPFDVPRDDGSIYKCRWSSDDNKYNHRTDTRCTYTNYEWNGQSYVVHQTTDDKILTLDLSDKFKETPKNNQKFQKDLYDETITYIKDTKLGTLKNSIKVAFVKLSSSPEYSKWKELEKVSLGDVVHVIYEDLGVNEKKKIIKTEYNVLTETYDSIEIGDKGTGFVDAAITQGDSVSALTNDRNFADITTVTKLVAERIEADYIQAMQAEITEAQIQSLTATELNATIVTAQKFEIDKLVASLLTADDAAIRNTLVVGDNLIVNGEVNIKNGSISISAQERMDSARTAYYNPEKTVEDVDFLLSDPNDVSSIIRPELGIWYKVIDQLNLFHYYTWQLPTDDEDGKYVEQEPDENVYFNVDTYGNVTANSLTITGGSIEIDGPSGSGTSFSVTNEGYLTANGANIQGEITADSGVIGNCQINSDGDLIIPSGHVTGTFSADVLNGGTITGCKIAIGPISGTSPTQYNFEVDKSGNVTANSLNITGGSINIEGQSTSFSIDKNGNLEANSVTLTGGTIENLHITGSIYFRDSQAQITEAYVRKHSITYKHNNVTMSTDWDSGEVRRHVTLYIQTSFEIVGRYEGLEGLGYDDVFDPESEPYDSETDPNITEFEVLDDDGHDYTGAFINYVCDDQPRVYLHNGDYEYTDRNFGFESDDDIIAYDKQSNWLSLTDYVPGQGDGPALTPATGVIYAVYEDGIFKDFYAWNGSSYVKTYGSQYYINEEGLRLNGIQVDDEQTRIGCLLVTETYLTTNPEKTSADDPFRKDGLYIGTDGISLYDEDVDTTTVISARDGLRTSSAQLDIFKDKYHSPADGATPVLYLIPDPQYLSTLGSGTGRITGVAYDHHTYFTSYIERVLINSNTTITINVQPGSTQYSPNLEKLTLIAAYATQTLFSNSTTLITKPLRVASQIGKCSTSSPKNIKIANDNSFAIYVNVCVVFKI